MKKLIIQNDSHSEIKISLGDEFYFIDIGEKLSVKTNSQQIYIQNKAYSTAKIRLGLQHDSTSYASPSWGFRPIYVNMFDSYFDTNDVCNFVSITEECYIAGASGIAVFTMYKVHSANKEVQKLKFHNNKDRKTYNFLRLVTILPLFSVALFLSLVVIFGVVTEFDIYILLFAFLLFLFWCLIIKVYKEQKKFYLIEQLPEHIMNEVEKVKIVNIKKWFIKYKVLTKKY